MRHPIRLQLPIFNGTVRCAAKVTIPSGTKLGRYEIRSQIGAGGMGEVYLAEDAQLRRRVALKILPVDLASNRDRMRRFIQEAQAAAALNHPNIAHIYEIGSSPTTGSPSGQPAWGGAVREGSDASPTTGDETHFIAMEFIDGLTLRELIHGRQTELSKLLRYLQHAAVGLAKAHAVGIVHRDLKPDNIMITREGHAKILDFGLAKLIEQQPMTGGDSSEVATAVMPQHSSPGTVVGTVGYMSPEQALGKTKELDHRSDIFSFGCILFEAVTGKRPFKGESAIKSLHMLVYEPAPQLADLNPSAPAELQRIVRRCLAKDPDERYQSIKEVAIELKELRREFQGSGLDTTLSPPSRSYTTGVTGSEGTRSQSFSPTTDTPSLSTKASSAEYVVSGIKQHKLAAAVSLVLLVGGVTAFALYLRGRNSNAAIKSIAVMPFVNESGNADVEYLADGMTETLISSLSQLPNLNVKARSSVFRYKGKETNSQTVGKELNVQAILNGRVVQRGDELTLSLELIDAQTENVIWSERYKRKQSDLVTLQSEIAHDVSSRLKTKLSGSDETKVTKTYTANPEAYQLYLKGRFHFDKRTKEDLLRSIQSFEQAINLDPNFALAYVGVADSYGIMSAFGYAAPNDVFPKAKAAARRALQIDPDLAEAHGAYARLVAEYDWNWSEAEREFKRSIELNPNIALTHYQYGVALLTPLGRFDEAINEIKRALELEPLSVPAMAHLAGVYATARKNNLAVEQGREALNLGRNHPLARFWLAFAYNASGMYVEAISVCESKLQSDPTNQGCLQIVGYAYAKSGRRLEAEDVIRRFEDIAKTGYAVTYRTAVIHALLGDKEKAFAGLEKAFAAHDWDMGRINVDPFVDSLRDDPRFKGLIKRMGFTK